MYHDQDGRLVKQQSKIARRYLRTTFIIDFVSILPYDTVRYMAPGKLSSTAIRFIRIPRLLKLLRLTRLMRIFRHWESHFGVLHQNMLALRLALMLFAVNHWLACVWGMIPFLQPESQYTWFSAWLGARDAVFFDGRPAYCNNEQYEVVNGVFRGTGLEQADTGKCYEHTELYVASLHWAMMTVTSIGYGDIVPQTVTEYSVCVVFMLIAGASWAVIIGGICGVVSAGDEVERNFNKVNDNMNRFMAKPENRIHVLTKRTVRKYMAHSKSAMRQRSHRSILSNLSPLLAGELTMQIPFIRSKMCAWLVKASAGFCAELIIGMKTHTFPPQEQIFPDDCMYVLKRGSVCSENLMPMRWISAFSKRAVRMMSWHS